MKKILLILMMLVGTALSAQAQVDEVTLVVSGEGVTKDEATTKALRSAIEQSFGVFVSASTEILNDELVRDEIATVSSGNIKKYTELGAIQLQNGKTEVTLQATVSIKKLTQYAKSHGSSAEFAGAVFAQNMKLIELNRQNTIKVIQNLNRQLLSFEGLEGIYDKKIDRWTTVKKAVYRDLYRCVLSVKNIAANGDVTVSLEYYPSEKAVMMGTLIANTLGAIAIPTDELQRGAEYYTYHLTDLYLYDASYDIKDYKAAFGKDWFGKGVDFVFYAPIDIINIEGMEYSKIYDNLGNEYDCKVEDWEWEMRFCYMGTYEWGRNYYLNLPGFFIETKKDHPVMTFEKKITIPMDIISKVSNLTLKQPEKIK